MSKEARYLNMETQTKKGGGIIVKSLLGSGERIIVLENTI